MTLPVLILVSFIPLALWLLYIVFSASMSFSSGLGGVLCGLAAVALASIIQTALDPVTSGLSGSSFLLFSAFIEAALIEEFCKLAALSVLCGTGKANAYGRKSLDRRAVLVRAVLVGLSFAAFENLMYFIRSPSVVLFRTLVSLPVHVSACLLASLWVLARAIPQNPEFAPGYTENRRTDSLWADEKAREGTGGGTSFGGRLSRVRRAGGAAAFVVAVLLHGSFNACMSVGGLALVPALFVVLLLVACALFVWNRTEAES